MTSNVSATPTVSECGSRSVRLAYASDIGGRTVNADAACVEANPLGIGVAVIDGIGSTAKVRAAARLAAGTAAAVASHRGAQAGIMAAADTMPDYAGAPNAVGAVVSIEPGGRIEIANVGDTSVWTWSRSAGLRRWTAGQTAGQHVAHMLNNPGLTRTDRAVLIEHGEKVVTALDDYVLNGLVWATISTISWTPLRGTKADVDAILLFSDGVGKVLPEQRIADLTQLHHGDAQTLADTFVREAVAAARTDPGETADNATAAVLCVDQITLA